MLSSYVFAGNLHSYYKALPTKAFKLKLLLMPSLEHQKQIKVQVCSDSLWEKGFI